MFDTKNFSNQNMTGRITVMRLLLMLADLPSADRHNCYENTDVSDITFEQRRKKKSLKQVCSSCHNVIRRDPSCVSVSP